MVTASHMIVIGLNHGEINSSAAIVRDGAVVAGAPEERFNRHKLTKAFPHGALRFSLQTAGVELRDCDAIAQAWNPGAGWHKFNPFLSDQRTDRSGYFYAVIDNLYDHTRRDPGDWVKMDFPPGSRLPPVYYVQHHRCHAANAFFLSPFDEAAILTCDFRGEFECTTMARGVGTSIETFQSQTMPHSLGMFYACFTELLGYRPDNDEWKVMALSAFDVECDDLTSKLRDTYRLFPDGTLELDQSYYKGAIPDQPKLYTPKLVGLVGGREGRRGERITEWHCRVARAMQAAAEEIALHFLHHLHGRTGCRDVVVSGGFFMNSVFNGQILDRSPFRRLYVPYAPADVGNSIGAALYVTHCLHDQPRAELVFNPSTVGPTYDHEEIVAALERRRIRYEVQDDIAKTVAQLLAAGHVVACFQGPMEFGERALGNRSILADPRDPLMKDRINAAIKYREAYRPFAPAVPAECVQEFFEVPEGFMAPYMEKVVPIRLAWRERLGAVTHVDGSGRVQTVASDQNARFHRMLRLFGEQTGVPVLLNTSFNINGEPIVMTPDDALTTFFNSGLEWLALGDCLVCKAH